MLLISQFAFSQDALKATGGTGLYKNDIYWLNFSGISNLGQGNSLTRNFTINGVDVTVVLDNIVFTGNAITAPGGTVVSPSTAKLEGYKSGSWAGDGLDNLYNIGGSGSSNTMTYALSTNYFGTGTGSTPLIATFNLSAYATVAGQPLDIGLVFASAEDDNNPDEYSQGTTNGSPWSLFEGAIQSPTQSRLITYSNSNLTARMKMSSNSGTTPSNVALLFTGKQATSSSNRLVSTFQFAGYGRSAIAIGVFIRQEFGDAPISYLSATNVYSATVSGGTNNPPAGGGAVHLSSGTGGGTPVITAALVGDPQTLRLGNLGGDANEGSYPAAGNGTNDNATGVADEDAFTSLPSLTTSSTSYSLSIPAFKNTTTASTPAYIMAWIDFNRNGLFEPSEYINTNFTTNNVLTNVPLVWNLASISKVAGNTFARFRITSTNPATLTDDGATTIDERSFVALANGETEDYTDLLVNDPCGITASNPDTDGDGISNACDLDDDNDGITDVNECTGGTNFALAGTATQSSTFSASFPASRAIDGNTAGTGSGNSIAHTQNTTPTEYWQVDLGSNRLISTINIFNRDDGNENRLSNVLVMISDTPFPASASDLSGALANADYYIQIGAVSSANADQFLAIPYVLGRYVRIQKSGNNGGDNFLNFAEVQVLGCSDSDNDGIPNSLEIDSDNDGCPDAIEGDAGLQPSALNASNQILGSVGTTTTTNGIPTAVGTGQLAGSAYNASIQATYCVCISGQPGFIDTDGDGLGNLCDLDDDNDGILDANECGATEKVINGDFSLLSGTTGNKIPAQFAALTSNAWSFTNSITGSSAGGTIYLAQGSVIQFNDEHPSQPFVQELTQNVTNVKYTNDGSLPQIVITNFSPSNGVGGSDPAQFGKGANFIVKYAGVEYARVATSNGTGTGATVTYSNGATGTPTTMAVGSTVASWAITLPTTVPNSGALTIRYEAQASGSGSGDDFQLRKISILSCKDTDGDGIPDNLDLDSDNDGCLDAIEGGADITASQLVNSAGTVSVGTGSTASNQNLCASATCINNSGLPLLSPAPTGYNNNTGQSLGSSQNALASACFCYETPTNLTSSVPVKHGITVLGRAGADNGNWPMLRNSAYTALEGKTKGFVVTRNSSPETTITNPVVGMMVFDTNEGATGCLKIYTGSAVGEGWKCFSTQGCP